MAETFIYDWSVRGIISTLRVTSPWLPKVKLGFQGRQELQTRLFNFANQHPSPFWFHVASSGELEQAIPVMDELKRRDPRVSILITYFSPSGQKATRLETQRRESLALPLPWDHADYSPLDLKAKLQPIFEKLRPQLLILVHRELWPNLIGTAQKFKVPVVLISSYWPDSVPRMGIRRRLRSLNWIGTVDGASALRLKDVLGERTPIDAVGDPRAERVLTRKDWNVKKGEKAGAPAGTNENILPIFLLASLHREDIAALTALPARMKEAKVRWVVVPHDPNPALATEIQNWLAPIGPATLWSEKGDTAGNAPIIVDKVGFLAELYHRAAIVVVGGSFYYRVHNVWEPAAYYKPILTGRFIENSAEALALAERGLLKVCTSAEEITAEAMNLLQSPDHYQAISQGLQGFLGAQAKVSKTYVDKLLSIRHQP